MSNTRLLMVSLAVIVVLIVGALAFFSHYHYVEKVVWRGFKGQAKSDPYYLTEQFLTRKGYHVTRERNYARMNADTLNGQYDTLFLTNSGQTLSETQVTAISDWVAAGGALVVSGARNDYEIFTDSIPSQADINANPDPLMPTGHDSPLLAKLGIASVDCVGDGCHCSGESKNSDFDDEDHEMADAVVDAIETRLDDSPKTPSDKADELLRVRDKRLSSRITLGGQQLAIYQRRAALLYALPNSGTQRLDHAAASCYGDIFALFSHGKGRISVYSDTPRQFSATRHWWSKPPIFTYHHATFLDALLQLGNADGKRVLWYESAVYPSIWATLWRYGAFAVVAAALLLLAWIWQNSRRFGSLLVEDPRSGLSMKRHLLASGRFYHRQSQQNLMLQHCYEQLDSLIARRIPSHKHLNKSALAQQIADKTDLAPAAIAEVLDRRYPDNDSDFTRIVHLINRIQQRL